MRPNDKGRFSRAELERKIIEHHESVSGRGTISAQDEQDLTEAAGAGDPWTFHNKLPAEIKDHVKDHPETRKLFRVTDDAKKAGGADAFGQLGDRYLDMANAHSGKPLRAAIRTAQTSQDPEMQFLAKIHANLPAGKFEGQTITSQGLRVGDKFKIGGNNVRVAEDEHGYRMLEGGRDFPETPAEYLNKIPIDKGSFRQAKGSGRKAEVVPF